MPKPKPRPVGRPPRAIDASTFPGRIAAAIRKRRRRLKLSVGEAADIAGVAASSWHGWENGNRQPFRSLPAIAQGLGCRERDLMPG